jgi:hypothetical protein
VSATSADFFFDRFTTAAYRTDMPGILICRDACQFTLSTADSGMAQPGNLGQMCDPTVTRLRGTEPDKLTATLFIKISD